MCREESLAATTSRGTSGTDVAWVLVVPPGDGVVAIAAVVGVVRHASTVAPGGVLAGRVASEEKVLFLVVVIGGLERDRAAQPRTDEHVWLGVPQGRQP